MKNKGFFTTEIPNSNEKVVPATTPPLDIKYPLGAKIPKEVIIEESKKYNNWYQIYRIVQCESHFYNVQSNIYYKGVREDSWGVGQINLYWNPHVKKEQALDYKFSIKFIADGIKSGHIEWWKGYNSITDTCNNPY